LNIGRRAKALDVLVAEQLRTSSDWLNALPRANSRRALRQPDARRTKMRQASYKIILRNKINEYL